MIDQSPPLGSYVQAIRACTRCYDGAVAGQRLPHKPRPVLQISSISQVLIAGQAPGTKVHVSGRPFTDRSGDRLRTWLGISSEDFYDDRKLAIVPMGFCFPGQDERGADLPPRKECVSTWHDGLFARRTPFALIVSIGRYARDYHLPQYRRESLTATIERFAFDQRCAHTSPVIQLPHPSWRNTAWLKKHPWFEDGLLPIIRQRVQIAMNPQQALDGA
ncbi:MAG: uracil-DNA glycosylase family protein [Pseudomonadota bacterium]